jgi:flavorubredoxin
MNQWLAAAPKAQVLFNPLGCMVSLNDLCDRPPVVAMPDEAREVGGRSIRTIATPHVPHGWEAQVVFDETTRTLFCGDLFTQTGVGPAIVHDADIVQPALDAEDMFHGTGLTPDTAATIRRLADLEPRTLALMHGPAYAGNCRQALLDLADAYEARLTTALDLTPLGAER